MLWELWHGLITPAPVWARRAGLLHQSIALEARYRRCRAAWDGHYARCRAVIEQAAGQAVPGGTVVVLGSGLLHDLPLDVLNARFEHILLVDAVHPLSARRRARDFPRIELIEHDLSGWLDPVAGLLRLPDDTRLAVSVNLLGQLTLPFEDEEGSAPGLIAAHLSLLRQAPVACLISDTVWRTEDVHMGTRVETDPWHGVPHPDGIPVACWSWEVAPRGEISRGQRQTHEVCAWLLQPSAAGD
ncbi:MAG: hypothetical protein AB1344_04200 [Pseudomonadota bacterium]